jgi:enterobactin synthetase component D
VSSATIAAPACIVPATFSMPLVLGTHLRLQMQLCRFDAAQFDHALFEQAGIACPAHIARSVRKRQAEFFAGRLCARAAMAALGAGGEVQTGGRREPLWPAGIVGSITHNRNLAGAVVLREGRWRGIGIDIESVVDAATAEGMLGSIVSEREMRLLQAAPGTMPALARLTVAFSAKESFFKAAHAHAGRYFDFDAVEIVGFDPLAGRLQFVLQTTLGDQLRQGERHEVYFDMLDLATVLTVCTWHN